MNQQSKKIIPIASLVILLMAVGSFAFSQATQKKASADGCGSSGFNHIVIIKNNQASPKITDGQLCDQITFINKDNMTREISFGQHDKHESYNGVAEKYLNKDQSFTINMNRLGSVHFHDHTHDDVSGYFNVYK